MTRRSIILRSSVAATAVVTVAAQAPVSKDYDERLTRDLPPKQASLLSSSSSNSRRTCHSVSSLGSDEEDTVDTVPLPSPATTSTTTTTYGKPRSIFGTYWEGSPDAKLQQRPSPPPVAPTLIRRSTSPHCVRADPYYNHYGLVEELLQEEQKKEEEPSVNTYEQTLRQCEVFPESPSSRGTHGGGYSSATPLWMSWFASRRSAPSLQVACSSLLLRGSLPSRRQVLSDSALHTTPLTSALRRGRFSAAREEVHPPHHIATTATTTTTTTPMVKFQATVQICSYEPPVESWAEEGWSSWFG